MWAFLIPLSVDLFSCLLGVRKAVRGTGSSGIPALTLPLYAVAAFGVFDRTWTIAAAIGAALVAHGLLVAGIPLAVGRWRSGLS